jgi:hypothetical protein
LSSLLLTQALHLPLQLDLVREDLLDGADEGKARVVDVPAVGGGGQAGLDEEAELLAHYELELLRTEGAVGPRDGAVAGDGHEVRVREVEGRREVLQATTRLRSQLRFV